MIAARPMVAARPIILRRSKGSGRLLHSCDLPRSPDKGLMHSSPSVNKLEYSNTVKDATWLSKSYLMMLHCGDGRSRMRGAVRGTRSGTSAPVWPDAEACPPASYLPPYTSPPTSSASRDVGPSGARLLVSLTTERE
jgi:hypothetical protein